MWIYGCSNDVYCIPLHIYKLVYSQSLNFNLYLFIKQMTLRHKLSFKYYVISNVHINNSFTVNINKHFNGCTMAYILSSVSLYLLCVSIFWLFFVVLTSLITCFSLMTMFWLCFLCLFLLIAGFFGLLYYQFIHFMYLNIITAIFLGLEVDVHQWISV